MKHVILLIALVFSVNIAFSQKFDSLAQIPPTGRNSWNKFGCNVDEDLIRKTSDATVSSGMKSAGFQYVVIDDLSGDRS